MRYDDLIWDFDGTLFDTYPAMCRDLQDVMAALGVLIPLEDLIAHFKISRGDVLEFCAAAADMTAKEVDEVYRAWVDEKGQPKAEPFPHVEDILARVRAAGGRNFVFTHRSGSVHDYLAKAGLTPYFTEVTSCGKIFERKPSPSGNLYLMEKYGMDPKRTLAVGDRELDVLAGKNAGADACLFGSDAAESAADYRIDSFEELAAIIGLPE